MQAVDVDSVTAGTVSGHRSGTISFRRLLQGVSGTSANFEASLVTAGADYSTPRHRHTFDQVRLVLTGTFNWAPRENLGPGTVLYVPEGTAYGPQRGADGSLVFIVQYGGASGAGFLSYDQLDAGHRELAERGSFENGIYHPGDGTRSADGYEAIYQYMTGRQVTYPSARYGHPVVMHPESFAWTPSGRSGITRKALGSFGELGHGLALFRLEAGVTHEVAGAPAVRVLFLVRGALRVGDRVYGEHSALSLEPGESLTALEALDESELFVVALHRQSHQ